MTSRFKTCVVGALAVFSAVVSTRAPIGPSTDLLISNNIIEPDGFRRSSVLAGGTFPGPILRGFKGDRFQANVINSLTDDTMVTDTSIHWHGIFQSRTNWEDGVAFVTQCPITPYNSFLYDFRVTDQAGTFWYHSHVSTQQCDGLRGPLIIYDPSDPHQHLYDVDDESTIITLADWYHTVAPAALVPGQVPPISNATLINGRGRYVGGPSVPLSVVNVQRFKRYRLRLVAMSCDPSFTFSIDKHSFSIIEADGQNTEPLTVDSILIFPGQRYSVVFHANQPVDSYWIRAEPSRGSPGFANGINSAILRYTGAKHVDPTTQPCPSVRPFREMDLHALEQPQAPGRPYPGGADVVLNIPHHVAQVNGELKFVMGGATFAPPTVPVLLQILSGARAASELLPNGTIYSLPPNKVIEISLPGSAANEGAPHPFHLHGHSFSVIRSANSSSYNFHNPVRRDTVNTGMTESNTTIRFVTDNHGPWLLHCHIDWHLALGLAVVLSEDIAATAKSKPPTNWIDLCPAYNSAHG